MEPLLPPPPPSQSPTPLLPLPKRPLPYTIPSQGPYFRRLPTVPSPTAPVPSPSTPCPLPNCTCLLPNCPLSPLPLAPRQRPRFCPPSCLSPPPSPAAHCPLSLATRLPDTPTPTPTLLPALTHIRIVQIYYIRALVYGCQS
ncbi:hypothetical protein Pmani_019055 [Petrolisthes manimaculis]|uniref:Uncharacterized protein n=1 Tax=Petrolisthes manimaculis TaxID=1843537 RepID=A0AAE1U4B5_9EUCA|nr:hypothetical protein Pmani_019055 [Petrolisthes manimaculis]